MGDTNAAALLSANPAFRKFIHSPPSDHRHRSPFPISNMQDKESAVHRAWVGAAAAGVHIHLSYKGSIAMLDDAHGRGIGV